MRQRAPALLSILVLALGVGASWVVSTSRAGQMVAERSAAALASATQCARSFERSVDQRRVVLDDLAARARSGRTGLVVAARDWVDAHPGASVRWSERAESGIGHVEQSVPPPDEVDGLVAPVRELARPRAGAPAPVVFGAAEAASGALTLVGATAVRTELDGGTSPVTAVAVVSPLASLMGSVCRLSALEAVRLRLPSLTTEEHRTISLGAPDPLHEGVEVTVDLPQGVAVVHATRADDDPSAPRRLFLLGAILSAIAAALTYELARRGDLLRVELIERHEALARMRRDWMAETAERRLLEQAAERGARLDPVTGLSNRQEFLDQVERSLARVRRDPGKGIAIVCVEIDQSRQISESLGLSAVDSLIANLAYRLSNQSDDSAHTASIGPARFATLLHGIRDETDLRAESERLRELLSDPIQLEGEEIFVSVSLGVALTVDGLERPGELLSKSEAAAEEACRQGRDQLVIYDASLADRAGFALKIESDLRRAILGDEFRLYYFPIVSLPEERIVGAEALIRWFHPRDGLVMPDRFIPLAEETGLIVQVTRWVLSEAYRQLQEWYEIEPATRGMYISVNLSARDFDEDDLCDFIASCAEEASLPADAIRLELTEGALLGNVQVASERIETLRDMQIPILLDDFGTGYSSLSYLHRFPFDYVKIDRSFVQRMVEGDPSLVGLIVNLAKQLGMRPIAEGVETAYAAEYLHEAGCDLVQGFYYSRPLPAEAILEFVRGEVAVGGAA